MPSEWVEWMRGYDDPKEPLARRLVVVQGHLRRVLDEAPPGPIRVASLCAGDGRDLLGVLREHPRAREVRARLVELDAELARRAREHLTPLRLPGVEVREGDASTTDALEGIAPVDLLLACGIFGNVADEDIRGMVALLPSVLAQGATVVWTRGRFEPDLTPTIRGWFVDGGFAEVSFVEVPGTTASVGVNRLTSAPRPFRPGARLFTFLPKEERPSTRAKAAR